jgi:hypothetical protein
LTDTKWAWSGASDSAAFAIRNILQINAETDRGEEKQRRDGVGGGGGDKRRRKQGWCNGGQQWALSNKSGAVDRR